jgi:hypothetical protein
MKKGWKRAMKGQGRRTGMQYTRDRTKRSQKGLGRECLALGKDTWLGSDLQRNSWSF